MSQVETGMHPNIWYPFTAVKDSPIPQKVLSGEGAWLNLEGDKHILDLISSWWVNTHGHARPEIAEAIYKQAQELEQVIFAGFTHNPAEQVAETLADKLPGDLNRFFFSDDGSTAVEISLKLAYQYWVNRGEPRKTFISFEGAYHGDTFGAMSVGSRSVFTDVFKDLLFDVEFLPYPTTWIGDEEAGDKEDKIIEQLENLLDENPDKYAGIIIEPLIQGAGGMRMCSEEFLQKLHWVNRQYNTLLIFDEVMTGFGRTGEWFAADRAQVQPDLMCLSKGITGGFLPLAVTACTDELYEEFDSRDPMKTFYHGHSYTANPLGCAAAIASLKLMDESESSFKNMEAIHREHLNRLADHPRVEKTRVTGTVAAMDIVTEEGAGYLNKVAGAIKEKAFDEGLLIRPLGNVLYLLPPYCITHDELDWAYEKIEKILDEI